MYFEQFYLGCLAHASYMLGAEGEAAVVDPQRDVELYLTADPPPLPRPLSPACTRHAPDIPDKTAQNTYPSLLIVLPGSILTLWTRCDPGVLCGEFWVSAVPLSRYPGDQMLRVLCGSSSRCRRCLPDAGDHGDMRGVLPGSPRKQKTYRSSPRGPRTARCWPTGVASRSARRTRFLHDGVVCQRDSQIHSCSFALTSSRRLPRLAVGAGIRG